MYGYTPHTVLPFTVEFQPGSPAYEQVLYAVHKAILQGQLSPGEKFPSVRALSVELQINPSTAHKVVAALTAEGLLEVQPGVGTVLSNRARILPEDRTTLLKSGLERLVVDARRLGLTKEQVVSALLQHWKNLS